MNSTTPIPRLIENSCVIGYDLCMIDVPHEPHDDPALPADFLERLYNDVEPLTAMDFLPTNGPQGGHAPQEEVSSSRSTPWSAKQIYIVGDTITRGEPPSEAIHMATMNAREYLERQYQQRRKVLATTPHLNALFAHDIQVAQELLASDFGERMPDDLFHVVREDDFLKLTGVEGASGVFDSGRHVIIGIDEATERAYGSPFMVRSCLQGGVTAAAQAENIMAISERPASSIARLMGRKTLYQVGLLPHGNLDDLAVQKDGHTAANASYLSKGFINSYAIEGSGLIGATYDTEGIEDILMPHDANRPSVGYSHGYDDTPYIRQQTGRLMLPFRYLAGLSIDDTQESDEDVSQSQASVYCDHGSVAALGFDLLDNRAPGLRQAMRALITDPNARERVIGLIDNVKPGLYKELANLQDDAFGYWKGTEHVLEVLGLTDTPVGTGLDIY